MENEKESNHTHAEHPWYLNAFDRQQFKAKETCLKFTEQKQNIKHLLDDSIQVYFMIDNDLQVTYEYLWVLLKWDVILSVQIFFLTPKVFTTSVRIVSFDAINYNISNYWEDL